jgi:hypothetical protein
MSSFLAAKFLFVRVESHSKGVEINRKQLGGIHWKNPSRENLE